MEDSRQSEKSKEWGPIRQGIFWAAFCILLALAAFETGWIVRDFQKDGLTEKVYKHEAKSRTMKAESRPWKDRKDRRGDAGTR